MKIAAQSIEIPPYKSLVREDPGHQIPQVIVAAFGYPHTLAAKQKTILKLSRKFPP